MSERLRALQKRLGYTQMQLAVAMGIHASSIGSYLYGNRVPEPSRASSSQALAPTRLKTGGFSWRRRGFRKRKSI